MCLVLQCYSPQTVLIQGKYWQIQACFKCTWVPSEPFMCQKSTKMILFLDGRWSASNNTGHVWLSTAPAHTLHHINYELWILAAQTEPENKADYRPLPLVAAPRARYQNLKWSLINSCDQCTAALHPALRSQQQLWKVPQLHFSLRWEDIDHDNLF